MEETRILIFGGTTEGRIAADYLTRRQIQVHVCVATEYGEQMLTEHPNLTVSHRRMDQTEMEAWIQELGPRLVIDATHPYAREVTENLREACEETRDALSASAAGDEGRGRGSLCVLDPGSGRLPWKKPAEMSW